MVHASAARHFATVVGNPLASFPLTSRFFHGFHPWLPKVAKHLEALAMFYRDSSIPTGGTQWGENIIHSLEKEITQPLQRISWVSSCYTRLAEHVEIFTKPPCAKRSFTFHGAYWIQCHTLSRGWASNRTYWKGVLLRVLLAFGCNPLGKRKGCNPLGVPPSARWGCHCPLWVVMTLATSPNKLWQSCFQ